VDRESSPKEVWRAELLARLTLLDRMIYEQAVAAAMVREKGGDPTEHTRRSNILKSTREHYLAMLKELLFDGKPPQLWGDTDPDTPASQTS